MAIALLKDQELADFQEHAKPIGGGITVDPVSRLISAEIPRDRYRTEVVIAPNIVRKATPRPIRPLSDFMDALAARDPAASPNAAPNNCRRPPAKPV